MSARVLAESDNESVPTSTPTKKLPQKTNIHVKTLEEIRLERIQAESAAFYAYNSTPVEQEPETAVGSTIVASSWDSDGDSDLRTKFLSRKSYHSLKTNLDFRVMTLDEIRKNRQQEEGNYTVMEKKTDIAVSSSRDILDSALSVKQFSSPFDVANNNTTSDARFQIRQKISTPGHSFEEEEGVCVDGGTVLFNRIVGSEKNDVALTEPITQIEVGVRDGYDGTRTGENLIENYKSSIVIKTLSQIRAEKNSLIENTSTCIPKRSHSPIVFDCLSQKLSCTNTENEKDCLKSGGEGMKRKPMIIRKHILESGPNLDEKESSSPPKKLRRFVRRTLHEQVSESKSDSEGAPRKLLKLRRDINTAVAASESSRVIRLTSDLLKNSELSVEVPPNINNTVCTDLLKVNGIFCVGTEGSDCDRLRQPLTNISGDNFKPDSVSVTRSFDYDENSSTPFDVSRSDVSRNSGVSLRTTTDSPTTCVLPGKYFDTSVNELVGDRIDVTQSSKLEPSERLEFTLAYTKNSDYVFGAKGKLCSVKPLSILPIEQDGMDTDEELLLASGQDNSMTLDAGEDILQDIDDLLNDD